MSIWCLFSIAKNYDQPDNNLVAWWREKPTLENLARSIGKTFPGATDAETIAIVHLWSGKRVDLDQEGELRLENLIEGVLK